MCVSVRARNCVCVCEWARAHVWQMRVFHAESSISDHLRPLFQWHIPQLGMGEREREGCLEERERESDRQKSDLDEPNRSRQFRSFVFRRKRAV